MSTPDRHTGGEGSGPGNRDKPRSASPGSTPGAPVKHTGPLAGASLMALQRLAGNAAVTRVLQRQQTSSGGQGQSGWTFSVTQPPPPDLRLSPDYGMKMQQDDERRAKEAEPKVRAWLQSQRADIETRCRNATMGLTTDPTKMLTMPQIVDLVRINIPDAKALEEAKLIAIIQDWAGFTIPTTALVNGQIPLPQMQAYLDNMLRVPGKVKVDRRGDDFIEVNLESVQLTQGMVQGQVFWEGGVGFQVQPRENVAGSFQLNADGTWKGQLVFGKNATAPVVNQMYNVWSAARGAMQQIASAPGNKGLLDTVTGPVKDAVDTLNSVSSKEEPRVGVSVTAQGGPGKGIEIEAAVTVHF